jgi:hypothetical protein
MKRLGLTLFGALLSLVTACGDGDAPVSDSPSTTLGESGLPLTTYMDELSEADRRGFCRWQADLYGGAGSSAPCGASSFKIPSLEDCAKSASAFLHVSVATTEACIDDLLRQGDICSLPNVGACVDVKAARAAKPPSNGSCSSDRWSMDACQVPDFF